MSARRNTRVRGSLAGLPARRSRRRVTVRMALAGAGFALLLAGSAFAAPARLSGTGVDAERAEQVLRAWSFRPIDGRTVAAAHPAVRVVHFWASWCGPCRREMPRLDALSAEIAAKGGEVLAVSIDQDPRNAAAFVDRYGLKLPVACDGPAGLARTLDLQAIPCTLVLDRDGNVVWSTARSDEAGFRELSARTRELLSARPTAAAEGTDR